MHQSIPATPSPSPPPADPRALAFFFVLDGKFPGMGTQKGANAPSSVSTATFLIDRTVEQCHFKHFNVRFFVSINVFTLRLHTVTTLPCEQRLLFARHLIPRKCSLCSQGMTTSISLWFFSIVIKLLTLKLIVQCKVNCYEQFYKQERMFFNNINKNLIQQPKKR